MQKTLIQGFGGFVIPLFSFRKSLNKTSKENFKKMKPYVFLKTLFTGREMFEDYSRKVIFLHPIRCFVTAR